jgi:RNA polymerase sigma-B factor
MELGRTPTLPELAEYAGVTEEQIVSAMELTNLYRPKSLNLIQMFEDWESSEERQDLLGQVDPRLDAVVEFDSLYTALDGLDDRKHRIVRRRFFDQCTQREVARELGLSQMHVSRLEREALEELRLRLEAEQEEAQDEETTKPLVTQ